MRLFKIKRVKAAGRPVHIGKLPIITKDIEMTRSWLKELYKTSHILLVYDEIDSERKVN